mmetsp:Transcript_10387/g.27214  ORF Transcript_10387/g.27214 Transcript_10387/m.27214 type:complete len:314 (+) Transcript_10387:37-978(+)
MGNSGSRGRRGQQYSDKKGKRKSHGRKASGAGLGKSPHADAVGGLAPVERSRLLCGSDDCNVVLYDLAGKNIVQRWEGHTRPVTKVCAAPGGEAFFSASRDLSLKMWREGAADEVGSFRGHELTVSAVAVSKDGSTLVSGSRDYSVRVWDVETTKLRTFSKISRNIVTGVCFLSSQPLFVQTSEDLRLRVWDSRAMQTAAVTEHCFVHLPLSCDVSPDENYFLITCNGFEGTGCEVMMWDRRAGKMLHSLEGHIEAVTSGCFLPSLQQSTFPAFAAATASKDGEVKVWDMNAGKEVESLSCGENLLSLAATRG